jgi:hypothetical protein
MSLTITFTLLPSCGNSKAVVQPCLPCAMRNVALSPNCENTCLIMAAPMSSATVNSVTFAPILASAYATLTAFPPLMSIVGTPRTLPPPFLAFSSNAEASFSFESSLITRSTKKSGMTTMEPRM